MPESDSDRDMIAVEGHGMRDMAEVDVTCTICGIRTRKGYVLSSGGCCETGHNWEMTEAYSERSDAEPNQYEQAKNAVRDGVTPSELCNILYSLPPVYEAFPDFEEYDDPTQVTVGFGDFHGTREITEIMHCAGYKVDVTVFSYNRIHYVEADPNE